MDIADPRIFTVYCIVNGHPILEIEGLDLIKYNGFKNYHNHLSNEQAIQIIVDHLSAKQLKPPEGIRYIYKSVDAVDFQLIYTDVQNRYGKLRIFNSTNKYFFDYTINHADSFTQREGRICDIPVELYIKAKECESMFYSLMLRDFQIQGYIPDVEIETLHYSIDGVDYESCNLDTGINSSFLPVVQLKSISTTVKNI